MPARAPGRQATPSRPHEAGGGTRQFVPGEVSSRSGVYRVIHVQHRKPHEAAVMAGERFPACRGCGGAVRFELVLATKGSASTERDNPSVLIASQEPAAARRLRSLLSERGYFVAVAEDATSAREQLQQRHCDAIIANLDLGNARSGLDVARFAKQLEHQPLVFIYINDPTTDAMREVLRTRVDYCALEPLNLSEVSSALETMMARRLS